MECVFCQIVAGKIPSVKRYEDAEVLAFDDVNQDTPVHILIVPKKHILDLHQADGKITGKMLIVMAKLADQLKIRDGYRIELNAGRYQEIPHLHFHLKGGMK